MALYNLKVIFDNAAKMFFVIEANDIYDAENKAKTFCELSGTRLQRVTPHVFDIDAYIKKGLSQSKNYDVSMDTPEVFGINLEKQRLAKANKASKVDEVQDKGKLLPGKPVG